MPNRNKKILVCIDSNPFAAVLLKKAQEEAENLSCPVAAIYVESSEHYKLDDREIEQLKRNFKKANSLGIEAHQITGQDVAETIKIFVEEGGYTSLYVGSSSKSLFRQVFKKPLNAVLIQKLPNVAIIAIALPRKAHKKNFFRLIKRQALSDYIYSFLVIAAVTIFIEIIKMNTANTSYEPRVYNIAMLQLFGTLFCSIRFGFLPGLLSAILAFISLNLFNVGDVLGVQLDSISDYVNMAIFIFGGVAASAFSGLSREQIRSLTTRESQAKSLLRLRELTSNIKAKKEAIAKIQKELSDTLGTEVVMYITDEEKNIEIISPQIDNLRLEDKAIIKQVIEKEEAHTFSLFNKSRYHFEPIQGENAILGVIAILQDEKSKYRNLSKLYVSLANHCGLILDNINLSNQMEDTLVREEKEKLRSALLSSVSHDLKTPLASIIGALSAVKQMGDKLDKESCDDLTLTALEEAERLDSFITNILDMTKLESQMVQLDMQWISVDDLIKMVVRRMRFRAKNHNVEYIKPERGTDIKVDKLLFGQVLQNLIDNAVKYSPRNSNIFIDVELLDEEKVAIRIVDEGNGIPDEDKDKVFDKFTRLKKKDSKVAGTGLGLAICKAIIDEHGAKIKAHDNPLGKGTIFKIILNEYRITQTELSEDEKKKENISG